MTAIATSTASTASAYSNQRKADRTQTNGVLWAHWWDGSSSTTTSMRFAYSTDNGATWTDASSNAFGFAGTGTTYTPNASIFIDLDDNIHVVYKDRHDGHIRYRRGTPNADRTAWTWSAAATIRGDIHGDYPDVIAHREGTGWNAHVVISAQDASNNYVNYRQVSIASDGTVTLGTLSNMAGSYSNSNETWPSIDFNHTGDGKTVAGSTPHLYAAWSAGATGAGKGIRFKKATYSAGSWTWGTEREIDSTKYLSGTDRWGACLFDGVRVVIGGTFQSSTGASLQHMLYERDVADTATVTRVLGTSTNFTNVPMSGSFAYDANGNVYFFGVESGATAPLHLWKWDRASATRQAKVLVNSGQSRYASAKRGYSNNRIEFIYTDGTASPYNVAFDSISLNTAPNAPTSLSPNGATIDKDAAQRFSWAFSDPDTGDSQSAYDLRYRVVGTSTWTVVSGGATQYHDFAADTFAAGDWEWQVRTTDNGGLVGPYSSSATFTAAAAPAAPSISSPVNGGTVSTEQHTVQWTAASQDAYEVRRVADNAGSPDTGTVYATTGTVVSTGKSQTMTFPVNNRNEHVQVRVRASGLWSSWASVRVLVSYTPPATPTLTATGDNATASITVDITNPAPGAGEPTVVSNEVWVRVAAGGRKDIDRPVGGDGVRIATGIANSGSFVDRAPASGVAYEHRVKATGDNGTSAWSPWTA